MNNFILFKEQAADGRSFPFKWPGGQGLFSANGLFDSGTLKLFMCTDLVGKPLVQNPLAFTSGSAVITVTEAANGRANGDIVLLSGMRLLAGNSKFASTTSSAYDGIPREELLVAHKISNKQTNAFDITVITTAKANASALGGPLCKVHPTQQVQGTSLTSPQGAVIVDIPAGALVFAELSGTGGSAANLNAFLDIITGANE